MAAQGLTHLSLFSGIGGLDVAAEWAGFQTVGQCEWADYPTQILECHWPDLPRWRDIRTLTKEDFHAQTGRWTVDIVSGGFPCQPFSLAGSRRGTADDRYLWPELLRVVSELRPTWVIGENVFGLVSMVQSSQKIGVESRSINRFEGEDHYEAIWARQENLLLVALLQDLERIGYEVQTFVIPACAVGARHRRDRIAIVAHRNSSGLEGARSEQQAAGFAGGCENVGYAEHDGFSATAVSADAGATSHHHPKREDEAGQSTGTSRPGNGSNVAHAESQRLQGKRPGGEQICGTRQSEGKPKRICNVQHTTGERLSDRANEPLGGREQEPQPKRPVRRATQPCVGGVADGLPPRMDGTWDIEPDIPRVTTGGSNRVDRLKCLGNAVVPQQFYPIFAAIATIEQEV